MAKKIRFPLDMGNGIKVRTLEELRENFVTEKIIEYYIDGKLIVWLKDRYLDDIAENISKLDKENPDFTKSICAAFGVEYNEKVDIKALEARSQKLSMLKQYTEEKEYFEVVDDIAFNQDDLYDLLDDEKTTIYLCGDRFLVSLSKRGVHYIGINFPEVIIDSTEEIYFDESFSAREIQFDNVKFQVSAGAGAAKAMNCLGYCYQCGYGVEKDYSKAIEWYKKSAEQGSGSGQNNLGYCYQYGCGVEKDYSKAVEWYKKSAEQGHRTGQYNLGYCYEKGYGVEKDYSKTIEWYKKSAEQGSGWAQDALGDCFYYGRGVEKDYSRAVEWYKKSAEQEDDSGQYDLGYCYEKGYGVEKNYSKAVEWYKKSAEQGNSSAQNNLGYCYEKGYGVEKDYSKAVEWYKKSAEQGNSTAQNNLARLS